MSDDLRKPIENLRVRWFHPFVGNPEYARRFELYSTVSQFFKACAKKDVSSLPEKDRMILEGTEELMPIFWDVPHSMQYHAFNKFDIQLTEVLNNCPQLVYLFAKNDRIFHFHEPYTAERSLNSGNTVAFSFTDSPVANKFEARGFIDRAEDFTKQVTKSGSIVIVTDKYVFESCQIKFGDDPEYILQNNTLAHELAHSASRELNEVTGVAHDNNMLWYLRDAIARIGMFRKDYYVTELTNLLGGKYSYNIDDVVLESFARYGAHYLMGGDPSISAVSKVYFDEIVKYHLDLACSDDPDATAKLKALASVLDDKRFIEAKMSETKLNQVVAVGADNPIHERLIQAIGAGDEGELQKIDQIYDQACEVYKHICNSVLHEAQIRFEKSKEAHPQGGALGNSENRAVEQGGRV